ncbi:GntR family transcriptional regulator [Humisphaera borealis]|uniref:GntR family transcriptional regulator n=1 Tax=Humisphaera borealis TaxID=2807512 RepID=A0A7M2WXB2_9BACT|nr:GntR family transcriptional regulator [Humisphaera borealis]QOV90135.1 GntR family transcriptional regulator [Humisphaera borealis]
MHVMIERRTISDEVYQHLLREILSGRIPVGQSLQEHALAMTLSVSRSAVREAFWRLLSHGIVETRGKLTVVRHFGPQQIRQVFQVREALEALATELACGRMTNDDFDRLERLLADVPPRGATHHQEACHRLDLELHGLIALRCGNPLLRLEIERLHGLVQLVRFRVGEGHGALEAALRAHMRIIEALRDGDSQNARRLMAEHIRESGDAAAKWAIDEDFPAEQPIDSGQTPLPGASDSSFAPALARGLKNN